MNNIYIWVLLVNSESLLGLVKYMFCSHFTKNCIFMYFLEAKNPCFVMKNCWKCSYILVFILPKKRRNWFHKNLQNLGMVAHRKLPNPLLKRIFNALSIGVQYTVSFQWTNFDLSCLLLSLVSLFLYLCDSIHIKIFFFIVVFTAIYVLLFLLLQTKNWK